MNLWYWLEKRNLNKMQRNNEAENETRYLRFLPDQRQELHHVSKLEQKVSCFDVPHGHMSENGFQIAFSCNRFCFLVIYKYQYFSLCCWYV